MKKDLEKLQKKKLLKNISRSISEIKIWFMMEHYDLIFSMHSAHWD